MKPVMGPATAPAAVEAHLHPQQRPIFIFIAILLLFDSLLTALIVYRVPYTKIDWDAYMSQVDGFLGGERNYNNLRGDTGPLVYPAGFLYVYTAIQYLTGGSVFKAQIIFGVLYILNIGIVLAIYYQAKLDCIQQLELHVPSLVESATLVSLYVGRGGVASLYSVYWKTSVAVSVKMNVLLYAPPLLLLLFKGTSLVDITATLLLAALVQVLLGMPFLLSYPLEYMLKAFDLGRIFLHIWSVNFKFVPKELFISKGFALSLLVLHLSLLILFAQFKWCKHEQGLFRALKLRLKLQQLAGLASSAPNRFCEKNTQVLLEPRHITTVLCTGNFIGVLCARSLHYQFYSWYFYSLPYLLWKTPFPTFLRLIIFGVVEACWNVYPSNSMSSFVLLACHLTILLGLWRGQCENPYTTLRVEKFE